MTPRQQLIVAAARRIQQNNYYAMKQSQGTSKTIEIGGDLVQAVYTEAVPGSHKIHEIIEGTAHNLGGDAWEYYLKIDDEIYARLEREIYHRS